MKSKFWYLIFQNSPRSQILASMLESQDNKWRISRRSSFPHWVKKLSIFCVTRSFISMFTTARHLSLFRAKLHQPTPSNSTSWRYTLILYSHLLVSLWNCLYLRVPSPKLCVYLTSSPYLSHVQIISASFLPCSSTVNCAPFLRCLNNTVVLFWNVACLVNSFEFMWIRTSILQHACHYSGSYNPIGHRISSVCS